MNPLSHCQRCLKLKPYQDAPDARWYYPCPCKVPMTEEKVATCPVSRVDGQGNKHPCRREHAHSGDHRYGLVHCPVSNGDCTEPCVGSTCLKYEKQSHSFAEEVSDALNEAAKACCHTSPIGTSMLCDLPLGHEGMHANKAKMSSWPTDEQRHRWAEGAVFSPRSNGGTCTQDILCTLADGHEGVCQQSPNGYVGGRLEFFDPIKPDYYHGTAVDDFIAEFKLGFRLGSVIKYIARHEHKDKVKDLKKALWYLTREIEKLEGK